MQTSSQQHNPERNDQKNGSSCPDALPVIPINNCPLHTMTDNTLAAVKAYNHPPVLFQQNSRLVRMRYSEGIAEVEQVNEYILRYHVDQAAFHHRRFKPYDADARYMIELPLLDTMRNVLSMGSFPQDVFPVLLGIIPHPYYSPTGRLIATAGYDTESCLLYQPAPGFVLPPVPDNPTREEVKAALRFIAYDYLADFPFVAGADLANACAFLFQPLGEGRVLAEEAVARVHGLGAGRLAGRDDLVGDEVALA